MVGPWSVFLTEASSHAPQLVSEVSDLHQGCSAVKLTRTETAKLLPTLQAPIPELNHMPGRSQTLSTEPQNPTSSPVKLEPSPGREASGQVKELEGLSC